MDLEPALAAAIDRAVEARISQLFENQQAGPDRFVRSIEAARLLGMSKTSLLRKEKLGQLPRRTRVGGMKGYRLSVIRQILGNT